MPLGAFHHYLLFISGFVLLLQTAVKSHYHQPDSYCDSRSSLHAPFSSLLPESPEKLTGITAVEMFLAKTCQLVTALAIIPLLMTVAIQHDPSTSRAPPST